MRRRCSVEDEVSARGVMGEEGQDEFTLSSNDFCVRARSTEDCKTDDERGADGGTCRGGVDDGDVAGRERRWGDSRLIR